MNLRPVLSLVVALIACAGIAAAQPGGLHPRCGTADILDALSSIKEKKGAKLDFVDNRPVMQYSFRSDEGHFLIHYNTSGRDSVSVVDRNNNSVPDFIDSAAYYLESAWHVEVEEYGYLPPTDNGRDGPEIDAYILEQDTDYYGYTVPEQNNPTGTNTVGAFLVLDNDYKGFPTPGIRGLRVTTAHEFHHVIQFSRYRADYSQGSLYEATAVWFEQQAEPSIPDYREYIDSLVLYPQAFGFSTHNIRFSVTGYAHELYLEYLAKKFGRDIVREIWDEFRTQDLSQNAIDIAVRRHGLDMEDSYCEFASWCYHCGRRARDTLYFTKGPSYPTMRAATVRRLADDGAILQATLYPLSFGLYQMIDSLADTGVRDTIDFLITNARLDFGRGGPTISRDAFTLDVSRRALPDYRMLPAGIDTLYYRLTAPSPQFCVAAVVGGSVVVVPATTIFPQPFINDGGAVLTFAVTAGNETVTAADLQLYTSSMAPVVEIQQNGLHAASNQLGVVWDGRDAHGRLAPSGVYIYSLSINGGPRTVGKIAVVQK